MKKDHITDLDRDIARDIVALLDIVASPVMMSSIEKTVSRRRTTTPAPAGDPCREVLGQVMNRHASNVLFHDSALAERCWDALASPPVIETMVRRCADIAANACLVEPDGGSPTQTESDICDRASTRILSILTPGRGDTPYETAA